MLNLAYVCTNWTYAVFGTFFRNKSWKWAYVVCQVGQIWSGQVGSGRVGSGRVGSGQVRSGQVRSGQVRSGQINQIKCLFVWIKWIRLSFKQLQLRHW